VAQTRGHIGFVGTVRTVASHTFRTEAHKLNPNVRVSEVAAPLLAPIVEEAWEDTEIARLAVQRYLEKFSDIDTLVLGCTHYPLLERAFHELTPPHVTVLNPAPQVAERFRAWRERHSGLVPAGSGRLRMLSSGDAARFATHGARFLGEALPPVEHMGEKNGRLAPCPEDHEPIGQVMRS
jgi:glutamate racemase